MDNILLGIDPSTGFKIYKSRGRYGPFVKTNFSNDRIKCACIKQPLTFETITLEDSILLLKYPKILGNYEGEPIAINKGMFGLYTKINGKIIQIENENISLEEIIAKINENLINEIQINI
ncbi:DNA topoisomerase 1 [uncultured virus]|nr:DNA topoisomerase 1 [uncultured virus]